MFRFILLSFLIACSSLQGDWEGEGDCTIEGDDMEWESELALEPAAGGEYEGEGEFSYVIEFFDEDGDAHEISWAMEFELTVETDGPGEQELDVESESTDCDIHLDGEPYSAEEVGAEELCNGEDVLRSWEFEWDGANTIRFDNDGCEGEYERL